MADKWLQALQKTENASRVPSTPVADPLLTAMFGATEDDVLIAPERMDKVHDDGSADVFDPVAQFLSKLMQGAAHVPQVAAPLAKRATDAPLSLFFRVNKIDEERRMVYGTAAAEEPDRQNEILDYEGSKPYFQAWSASVKKDSQGKSAGNLREMHTLSAVGTLDQIQFDDTAKKIEVAAKVVDDGAWKKCIAGVYSGFSIGGRYTKSWKDGGLTRYIADPCEVSLVDRPCIPSATFELVKIDGTREICKFTGGSMSKSEEFHKASYAHHDERATSHAKMMGHHDEGSPEHAFHTSGHESHTTMRDFHKCAMEKAAGDELNKVTTEVNEDQIRAVLLKMLGNTLMPTNVSAVTPVARAGQPPITPAAAVEKVPLEFRKLVSVEDGQDAPGVM